MTISESERLTRRRRIDPRVKRAGWSTIVPFRPDLTPGALSATAVEEYETANGPADYALCDGGRILGVAEAKKVSVGPQGVLTQAERYAKGIDGETRYQGEFGVPFLYSTNGEEIWFHDVRDPLNRSRRVAEFHTPAALTEMLGRDGSAEFAKLTTLPQNLRLRPYQIEANTAIEQAIRERKRKMLLTMATGTGKTLTMVNEVYRLIKSGVARRVLFLVDRRALERVMDFVEGVSPEWPSLRRNNGVFADASRTRVAGSGPGTLKRLISRALRASEPSHDSASPPEVHNRF